MNGKRRTRLGTVMAGVLLTTFAGVAEDQKPYDGSWESLQQMPVPAWFEDGKIGIFIHWGPYSVIGYRQGGRGYAEHVPKQVYSGLDHYYPYFKERWGATPPEFGYKDIIPGFKAENWNPDAWAKLYAIQLKEPDAPFVITGSAGWGAEKVKSVRLLGSDTKLASLMTPQGLEITPPADLGQSDHAWSFEIVTGEEQHQPKVVVNDAGRGLRGTKSVDLDE